ncbi:MAG: hypothetical protein JSV68_00505 [Anaerolineaceae bacterium]|nr:MAG: hypothetical protein JSV68_00505 [Anaerolineaceae bacterium]
MDPVDCQEAGTVERNALEENARGYAYHFQVYLPPCYELETERAYPVLYLLPGRGSGPGSWFAAGVNEKADELILSGKVPPFLIIATDNTDSDPQANTIYQELLPTVKSRYRVLDERQFQAVAGGSLGGIGAYRLVFQHPDQFASAGIFGSGLIYGEEAQLQSWLRELSPEIEPRVFLNVGEQDPLMLERAKVMEGLLFDAGIETASVYSPGQHTYSYWVSNIGLYFEWLAKEWQQTNNNQP